jgi:hypothetical protein
MMPWHHFKIAEFRSAPVERRGGTTSAAWDMRDDEQDLSKLMNACNVRVKNWGASVPPPLQISVEKCPEWVARRFTWDSNSCRGGEGAMV